MRNNICLRCICRKCSGVRCPYEKYYHALPFNPGCAHCTMMDLEDPRLECPDFAARSSVRTFRIRNKRQHPYHRITILLAALHKSFKELK